MSLCLHSTRGVDAWWQCNSDAQQEHMMMTLGVVVMVVPCNDGDSVHIRRSIAHIRRLNHIRGSDTYNVC
ncbi:hypothetical protein VNO78_22207 [Psophocarpus tetragonolobus]|uniref:Uncharacterized protein n=1 Tax=Psophocarpus tetragonolobus TaxID=3891 RepID=A0AAN9SD11_PSOTE